MYGSTTGAGAVWRSRGTTAAAARDEAIGLLPDTIARAYGPSGSCRRSDGVHRAKPASAGVFDPPRSASGVHVSPRAPVYWDCGRMMRLLRCCSIACAIQPLTLLMAKV